MQETRLDKVFSKKITQPKSVDQGYDRLLATKTFRQPLLKWREQYKPNLSLYRLRKAIFFWNRRFYNTFYCFGKAEGFWSVEVLLNVRRDWLVWIWQKSIRVSWTARLCTPRVSIQRADKECYPGRGLNYIQVALGGFWHLELNFQTLRNFQHFLWSILIDWRQFFGFRLNQRVFGNILG